MRERPSSPFLMSVADVPAARHMTAPLPGISSTLCSVVPVGTSFILFVIPGLIGESLRELTTSPAPTPAGAMMYLMP